MKLTKQIKADLFLLLITVVWGTSFILMKNIQDYLPSFAYLSMRFIIASLVLVLVFRKSLMHTNRKTLLLGSVLGIMLFSIMGFQVFGLLYTSASNSAFITGMNVVMVPIVSAYFLKKKPDISSVIGVFLAFIGIFFLTGIVDLSSTFGITFNFQLNFGDILTFLCALCVTLQIIFIDKFTQNHDPKVLSVMQVGVAAVLYTFLWIIIDNKPLTFNGPVIFTLLLTGILGTAMAFAGQTILQKNTTPTHTALIFTAEPVFGAVFALIIPSTMGIVETLKPNTIAGSVLILTGMLISELLPSKKILKP